MNLKLVRVNRWMAHGFISPVDRAINEIKQMGYVFSGKPDYTLIQLGAFNAPQIQSEINNAPSPVVILEFLNGSVIKWKELLKHPKVVGYIKGQVAEEVEGVHVGWNMALIKMDGNDYTNDQTFFDHKRDIDIHFSMVIEDYDNSHLTRPSQMTYMDHRMKSKNMVDEICKKHGLVQSGKCKGPDYLDRMKRSKVCISPWGCGEICHRTFEAIRLGAIPICPDMSYMRTWPNVIVPWETYVPCKHDFSDLDEVILEVVNNYDKYKVIAKNAYEVVKESWRNDVFANRFDRIIRRIHDDV